MEEIKLQKGLFILSLDVELAWGMRGDRSFFRDFEREREIIKKILKLLERYNIKATWAIVGHLFLEGCKQKNGVKHSEIIRPKYKWLDSDWFDIDPCSDINKDSLWYGKDIIAYIKKCATFQEVGSHTFSHIIVGDEGCSKECFSSELQASKKSAEKEGINLESFVFPQNKIDHLDVLKDHGFITFRGVDENWYRSFHKTLKKIAHFMDNYFMIQPQAVLPKIEGGILNIPGSYFYVHKRGWAKFLPVSFRVKKSIFGIEKAVKQKKIFHLWFHPFNIASDEIGLLAGLEEIFKFVADEIKKGNIDNLTMGELANILSNQAKYNDKK